MKFLDTQTSMWPLYLKMQVCFVSVSQSSPNKSIDALLAACIHHSLAALYIINLQHACDL